MNVTQKLAIRLIKIERKLDCNAATILKNDLVLTHKNQLDKLQEKVSHAALETAFYNLTGYDFKSLIHLLATKQIEIKDKDAGAEEQALTNLDTLYQEFASAYGIDLDDVIANPDIFTISTNEIHEAEFHQIKQTLKQLQIQVNRIQNHIEQYETL